MNKYLSYLSLSFFMLLYWGCGSEKETALPGKSKVKVSWKLISNFVGTSDEFDARFVLTNHGQGTLDASNWALFFNMAPRPILANPQPQPARVVHINGDWYKMVPEAGFSLAPGDSVVVQYSGTEGVIKETDAPLGLYMVHYDKAGKEERIEQIEDYTIEPFTQREQLLRGTADQLPLPDAQQRYLANLGLYAVPETELLPIIPSPVLLKAGKGTFTLDGTQVIHFAKGLEKEAGFLEQAAQSDPFVRVQNGCFSGQRNRTFDRPLSR